MAVSRGKHHEKLRTMVMAIAGDDLRIGTVFWFAGDNSKGIYEVLLDRNCSHCGCCGFNGVCDLSDTNNPKCQEDTRYDNKNVWFKRIDTID